VSAEPTDLELFAVLASESAEAVRSDPVTDWAPTVAQDAWLKVRHPIAIWRGGNQLGKSWGLALDIVLFATGRHPHDQTHRGPLQIVVASESWAQMDPLARKLWELLPKDQIDPKCYYAPGQGIKGYKEPVVPFVSGPSKGTTITLLTYAQGSARLAGGTYHRAYCDEPPPEQFWGELIPRMNRYSGHIRVTFTPTPESPPLQYLRDRVESYQAGKPGGIYELHTPLTEAICIPSGRLAPIPFMTEAKIERFAANCLEVERGMRLNGDWEPLSTGRWLTMYGPACEEWTDPPPGATLAVGIDHGIAAGKQTAVLIAVAQRGTLAPRVWVWAEVTSTGRTTPEQDARAILDMLTSRGLSYDDVDKWFGDRSAESNVRKIKKSNAILRDYLAAELKRTGEDPRMKWIETPDKSKVSVHNGFRMMNAIMGRTEPIVKPDGTPGQRSHWLVHSSCTRSREAYKGHEGERTDPLKDILDAQRYPVEKLVKTSNEWMGGIAFLYG
jgi:phage terminase large subunit-like protein